MDPGKLHLMQVDEAVESYTVGSDHVLDLRLVEADCAGSAGHARGLTWVGILTEEEFRSLLAGLVEIVRLAREGRFEIARSQEDCHTAIEARLTATLGEVGKRIHAARSRNDQVVTALRLFAKWELLMLMRSVAKLGREAVGFARRHERVPMVGRTHMQRAMPSTVGLWMGAMAEAAADDLALVRSAYDLVDRCPLGSAASYGVPLPLERERVSELLGFARLLNNSIHAANSRGKMEAMVLGACAQIMLSLSRYAQDLMLFTMPEFGYFSLPAEFCTGSSLMPQKRNPCGMELVRARTATVIAEHARVANIVKGLPTGYNRDGQETKEPFMSGLETTRASVEIMAATVARLEVHEEKLLAGFHPEVFATDRALELVASGAPFRDAYREVKENLAALSSVDPREAVARKTHAGATANPRFEVAESALAAFERSTEAEVSKARERFESLMGLEGPAALGDAGEPSGH